MLLLVSKSGLAPRGNSSIATRFLDDTVGVPWHFTISIARMVGWKVQPYDSVSTLLTTYVHEPPEAMLRESKTPCEVAPRGLNSQPSMTTVCVCALASSRADAVPSHVLARFERPCNGTHAPSESAHGSAIG